MYLLLGSTSALVLKKEKNMKRKKENKEDEFVIEPSNGMIYKFFKCLVMYDW